VYKAHGNPPPEAVKGGRHATSGQDVKNLFAETLTANPVNCAVLVNQLPEK
jgi:hypothetical protein